MTTTVDEESEHARAVRAEAVAFLETHARRRESVQDAMSNLTRSDPSPEAEAVHVQGCRDWQRTLYDGGWAGIAWPKEYGGRGETVADARIFAQEEAKFAIETGAFAVAIGMVGPTIIAHGTEEQKARFLPAMLDGSEIWCQLFSEPGAGSDLASLGTRADRDGDEYIVNGQKVWTSGAQYSDWAILLVRTNVDVPKHRGITYLLVDMRTEGIEVRPLRQATGLAHFNEVFLSDVRIPVANVLGPIDGGWAVTHTTLINERNLISGGLGSVNFDSFLDLARAFDRTDDPVIRQELARSYTRFQILAWLGQRARARAMQGLPPGPESSVAKLAVSQRVGLDGDLVLRLEGADGMLSGASAHAGGAWQTYFLNQWSTRIGGGTEQIQRNIMGERVLGLPGELRTDKDRPFRDVPKN